MNDSDEREVFDLESDSDEMTSRNNNKPSQRKQDSLVLTPQPPKSLKKSTSSAGNNNSSRNKSNSTSVLSEGKSTHTPTSLHSSFPSKSSSPNNNKNNNNNNNNNNNSSYLSKINHSKVFSSDSNSSGVGGVSGGQSNKRKRLESNNKLFSKYKFFLTGIDNSFHVSR